MEVKLLDARTGRRLAVLRGARWVYRGGVTRRALQEQLDVLRTLDGDLVSPGDPGYVGALQRTFAASSLVLVEVTDFG